MITLSAEGEARAAATERFVLEWRDPQSWVRREARERLAGGLWSGPVIEQALDNAFWMLRRELIRIDIINEYERVSDRALRTLVILPGNVIGPTLHAAYRVAEIGATAIFKAASAERMLAEIVARQWAAIGPPLAGTLEARYWTGGDRTAEAAAIAEVENVIVFGSDETVEAVRARVPPGVQFTAHGAKHSYGLVMAGADLTSAANGAAVDICMFDQAGCKSPQTIFVVGDAARALLFAQALDSAMRSESIRLPRMRPSQDEAAAVNDVLRRSSVTALEAPTHGLSPILPGPDNGGCPDYLIVVEPLGPPRHYSFGRIAVIMPLGDGKKLALTGAIEEIGIAGGLKGWPMVWGGDECDEPDVSILGKMQRTILAQPYSYDFIRHDGDRT